MSRAISSEDHTRISAAIKAAEERTSGEIYCVVARSSDGYFFPAAFMVTVAMVLVSLAVAFALERWWFDPSPVAIVMAQILTLACAVGVLGAFPAIRIHLVPRRQRYRHAHDNAMRQFLARNVHLTSARTGVLVFVSLAEHYAEIVADAGINQHVPQQTWNGVVRDLINHSQDGRLADGFVHAITTVGALLETHFPTVQDDDNELDDHLVEI